MAIDALTSTTPVPVRADTLCQTLLSRPTPEAIEEASSLLLALRDLREFSRLCDLAELTCRFRLDDAKAHCLYAQGLIETQRLTAAVEFLEGIKLRFGPGHSEYAEFEGLLGRAYKQLFMDTVDPESVQASTFIERASAAYAAPYERERATYFWHGINLGALAQAAKVRGLATDRSPQDYATELLTTLNTIDELHRDQWWQATKAEAHVALGEWESAERALRAYIDDSKTTPFMLASTLRQLRDLWAIQRENSGARLLQMLEATLMSRPAPGAVLRMGAQHLLDMRELEPKRDAHLERVAGPKGFETVGWYRTGLERASAVAAIAERLGLRYGTGFAVRAQDFGVEPGTELLLLTNFHVLNSAGLGGRSDFGNVDIVFEAVAHKPITFSVRAVVAESDSDNGLDYALLRLDGPTEHLRPLTLRRSIAPANSGARVYVIGYPLADVMQFSLQDNVLLDHECEPTGKPPSPGRRRVQYSASTEKGSSGSPVFDDKWDCIALHHAGGKRYAREERYGISALNGGNMFVEANQGIWIGSIQDHVKAKRLRLD